MKSRFDKRIKSWTEGKNRKRIGWVTFSALLGIILCGIGLGLLAFHPIDFKGEKKPLLQKMLE